MNDTLLSLHEKRKGQTFLFLVHCCRVNLPLNSFEYTNPVHTQVETIVCLVCFFQGSRCVWGSHPNCSHCARLHPGFWQLCTVWREYDRCQDGDHIGTGTKWRWWEIFLIDLIANKPWCWSYRNADFPTVEDIDLELRLARFELLITRRPLLLNSVLLRQNPHNVHEWHKRVKLYEGQPRQVGTSFTSLNQSIVVSM